MHVRGGRAGTSSRPRVLPSPAERALVLVPITVDGVPRRLRVVLIEANRLAHLTEVEQKVLDPQPQPRRARRRVLLARAFDVAAHPRRRLGDDRANRARLRRDVVMVPRRREAQAGVVPGSDTVLHRLPTG